MKYYANLEKAITSATTEEVGAAFRKYVSPERMVIIEAGDFSKKPGAEKKAK